MTYAFNNQIEDLIALEMNLDYDSIPIKTIMGYVKDMNKKDDYKIAHPCVYGIRNLHAYKMVPDIISKPLEELRKLYLYKDSSPYFDIENTDHIKKIFYKQINDYCRWGGGYKLEGDINDYWDLFRQYCYNISYKDFVPINKVAKKFWNDGHRYTQKLTKKTQCPRYTDMKQRWFGFDFIEGKVSEFGITFLKFTKPEYGKYLIDNGFTQKQLNKCNKKDLMKLCRSF
jgi:hypothetical protein